MRNEEKANLEILPHWHMSAAQKLVPTERGYHGITQSDGLMQVVLHSHTYLITIKP